jgi:hypothetical protein
MITTSDDASTGVPELEPVPLELLLLPLLLVLLPLEPPLPLELLLLEPLLLVEVPPSGVPPDDAPLEHAGASATPISARERKEKARTENRLVVISVHRVRKVRFVVPTSLP